MTLQDATFAAAVAVLASSGAAGIAFSGSLAGGSGAVSAEYIGFEDMARRVFASLPERDAS
ncbi:MAG TPA: hypothetical protein VEC01_01510 [Noviherbaspirillum sp.]|uniref:hypothetical protein n=1 Tax=Noviherbaspirillum sp. TaxID=1926288 RepID=UPI002D57A112|nr:hypothetical protein [Noviherbaspirillum sp.]HYD93973.1 hypothetical protein [Noviherbaspirillum sp.]